MELKFKAIKYWRDAYNTLEFRENIQLWFSFFAFSAYLLSILYTIIVGVDTMNMTPTQEYWMLIIVWIFIFFLIIVVWSFVSLVILCWKGIFGQRVIQTDRQTELKMLLNESGKLNKKIKECLKQLEIQNGKHE